MSSPAPVYIEGRRSLRIEDDFRSREHPHGEPWHGLTFILLCLSALFLIVRAMLWAVR